VYDCGFTKGNYRFRFRTGGVIIKDNKMLLLLERIIAQGCILMRVENL